jgi:hypothetical protein
MIKYNHFYQKRDFSCYDKIQSFLLEERATRIIEHLSIKGSNTMLWTNSPNLKSLGGILLNDFFVSNKMFSYERGRKLVHLIIFEELVPNMSRDNL